jgi:phospholipase C
MTIGRIGCAAAVVAIALAGPGRAQDCSNGAGFQPAPNSALNDKIQHVIVLMQENRSWDSYYATIGLNQCSVFPPPSGETCVDKLGCDDCGSNPDPTNAAAPRIQTFHQSAYCTEDTAHGWGESHVEFNPDDPNSGAGTNQGFTKANISTADPTGRRSMGHYDAGDLNYYNTLVKTFAFGDRYFSSVLDSTYPNREYLMAATSFGHVQNDFPPIPKGFPIDSIFTRLDGANPPITWKDYFNNLPQAGLVYSSPNTHFAPFATFFADLATCVTPATCQLPQVAFVDPLFEIASPTGLEATDEHPSNDIQEGQAFVASVVDALIASPVWQQSVLFLIYDEAGGFYDHVVPPAACAPDSFTPGKCADTTNGTCTSFGNSSAQGLGGLTVGFDRYGFRVPNAVISPWVKPGYVSHQVQDHTSILKFIETRFGLGALTRRDANADDMLDYFDFSQTHPPLADAVGVLERLPVPAFDPLRAVECMATRLQATATSPPGLPGF